MVFGVAARRSNGLLLAGLLAVLAGTPLALGQETVSPNFSGKDFGGLVFELPAQQGGIIFTASKTTVWSEGGAVMPGPGKRTLGGVVQRMFLRGDVRAKVGTSEFKAARAVVWIERLEDVGGQAQHQVAVYFDRVGNPMARAGSGQTGDRLMVTARVVGGLTLASEASPVDGQEFAEDQFVQEAHARMARYLESLDASANGDRAEPEQAPLTPTRDPLPFKTYKPGVSQPYEPGSMLGPDGPRIPASAIARVKGQSPFSGAMGDDRLFSSRGVLSVAAGQIALSEGPEENHLLVTGGVVLQWSEPSRDRSLQLSGQNAVVFLKPGKLTDLNRFTADNILGVYLEGDVVATDNRFTLRAPHVYYDVQHNQAYTVDAVFWTYDEQRGLPLYIRAASIRQSTRNSITATNVKIAASSFYDPILSLGASSVTVRREPRAGGGDRMVLDSRGIAPRVMGVPFAWFPGYHGDIDKFPLKDVRFENSSTSGAGIQTRWDFFGLTSMQAPPGLEFDLLADGWLNRGVAVGGDMRWNSPEGDDKGRLFGYWVPSDNGTDALTSGARIERHDEGRGMALYEQRLVYDGGWTAMLEGSYISDENFVDAYYETMAESRREFANSATLRHIGDNATFAATMKGTWNDFTANEYLLQSQGYTVNKVPEISYQRVADDLFSGRWPGALQYSSEYRLGAMSYDFTKPSAAQLGYPTASAAMAAFGFAAPTDSWATVLGAAGLNEKTVVRADTRQELDWNLTYGPMRITPFVVGRATLYDDGFSALATPDSDSQARLWAAGGVRASTQMQRVYEGAESSYLDIHKVRHIIEPTVAFWSAGTNRRSETLPIYDDDVEGIVEGTAVRVGVDQTFQTQRGRALDGTGGRVVDLLKFNVDYVYATSDTNRNSPLGQWYDARPEESEMGKFLSTEATLLLTDATSLTFANTYDFDTNQPARTTVGVAVEHNADFKSFAEMRFLNARNATYVDMGLDYRLTPKYTMTGVATYDTDVGNFQDVGVRVNREFADVTFSVKVRYNNITGETTTGVVVTPLGRNRRQEDLRRIGRDQYLEIEPAAPTTTERDSFP